MKKVVLALVVTAAGTVASAQTLYNNGPVSTGATTESGVAAPGGFTWSELQRNVGDLTNANTNAGVSIRRTADLVTNFRGADNFTITDPAGWNVTGMSSVAYRTGNTGASPFARMYVQIWDGRPGDSGSSVVFGDLTTNRLSTTTATNTYRIFNTVGAPGAVPPVAGSASGTTRLLYENRSNFNTVLGAGSYWVEWTYEMTTASFTSFTPNVTIVGQRGPAGADSRQATGAAWADNVDAGLILAAPANVAQELPFTIFGTVVPAPGSAAILGFGLIAVGRRRR